MASSQCFNPFSGFCAGFPLTPPPLLPLSPILIGFVPSAHFTNQKSEIFLLPAGLPSVQNDYDPALGQAAEALAKKWHTSDLMAIGSQGPKGASPSDIKDWSSEMLVAFLDKLASYRAKQPMHKQTTRQMAQLYRLDDSKNSEIKGSWYKLAINAGVLLLPTVLLNHKILLPHIAQRAVDRQDLSFLAHFTRGIRSCASLGVFLTVVTCASSSAPFMQYWACQHPLLSLQGVASR